ncbi:MAG: phytoene synthase [Kiritimatiellia bacterium]|jgi:phytoene synthase
MTSLQQASRQTMQMHSRSFSWAAWFLSERHRERVEVLYHFCRLVDDLADESPDPVAARSELNQVLDELDDAPRELVAAVRQTLGGGVPLQAARTLVQTVMQDLDETCFETDQQLLRYGYGVAGTVGLMMCAVLDAGSSHGTPHAVDLGVAMQISNICRDVREDAERGRIYLPAERLRRAGVEPSRLLEGDLDDGERQAVAEVVRDLLVVADRYYDSARAGLRALPWRASLAVWVAARVYRGIGDRLAAVQHDAWRGRVFVPLRSKLWYTAIAMVELVWTRRTHTAHDHILHLPLAGLPGANS